MENDKELPWGCSFFLFCIATFIIFWGFSLESHFETLLCAYLSVTLFAFIPICRKTKPTKEETEKTGNLWMMGLSLCTFLYALTIEIDIIRWPLCAASAVFFFAPFIVKKQKEEEDSKAEEVADIITRNMEKRMLEKMNGGTIDEEVEEEETADDAPSGSSAAVKELQRYRSEANKRMSEEYFNQVRNYLDDFFEFATQLDNDAAFKEYCNNLENIKVSFTDGDTFGSLDARTFRGKLLIIILVDMVRNFEHAGHQLDLSKPEEFGLLLYIYRLNNEGIPDKENLVDYDFVSIFYDQKSIATMEDFVNQFMAWPESEEVFFMSHLLCGYSEKLLKRYHIMMFSIISLIANCDGVVSKEENDWMDKVLQMPDEILDIKTEEEKKTSDSPLPTVEESFSKLNELIGLATVKQEVRTLANLIKIQQRRKEEGLKTVSPSYHCVFTGNPGTGKTTVARILADIYRSLGILEKGHLVETDRSGLVAEYVGQTAVKTNKIIDKALDGVLFIDEAYTLVNSSDNDFGREAIATLLKRMEDDRKRLVVILAGYTKEMKDFIDSNPGLQSRFNRYIEFPDYNADELLQIFESNLARYDYELTPDAREKLTAVLAEAVQSKDKNFGNGRFARNLFDKTVERQATRLASQSSVSARQLSSIVADDIPNAVGRK